MSQCLRIMVVVEGKKEILDSFIQKQAQKCDIEGMMQPISHSQFRIVACGEKSNIEQFLDVLHNELSEKVIGSIDYEPFLKDKDYRGVFRVIS